MSFDQTGVGEFKPQDEIGDVERLRLRLTKQRFKIGIIGAIVTIGG